jgi:hypothetical protein
MARAQKLKVFRTAAGFHDAYVAAPSQKAALAAWGSDADLFARGIAEVVTDEELSREPLAHPGTVIKRSRGTAAEQFAALPADPPQPARKEQARAVAKKTTPRPSRAKLDDAERALSELIDRQQEEDHEVRERLRAIEQERRKLATAHERARREAEQAVKDERSAHAARLDRWRATRP